MFTQCPECETTYRVSSEDLAGAHGEVECGSCGKRFDALARLCESLPVPLFPSDTEDTPPPIEPDTSDMSEETAGETSDEDRQADGPDDSEDSLIEAGGAPETISGEEDFAETDEVHVDLNTKDQTPDASSEHPGGGELTEEATSDSDGDRKTDSDLDGEEDIDDAGKHIGSDPEREDDGEKNVEPDPSDTVDLGEYDWQHTTVIQPQKPPPMEVHLEDSEDDGESRESAEPEGIPDYLVEKDAESGVEENPAPSELTPSKKVTLGGWIRWISLGALIVILLVWIHQAREMLVRHPNLRPVLTGFYSAIGMDLEPAWDLAQFAILSSTASEDRRGDLVVTVTYTNLAEFPQPYPTLKVVLEDRWGEALDVRFFEPNEYLAGFAEGRAMSDGESATGEVAIPSTGSNAVGFSVDVCLKPETSGIQCAADL